MADATQLKPRRRAGRFWLGLVTVLVWLLFGASIWLDIVWRQHELAGGFRVSVEWGGLRIYWTEFDPHWRPTPRLTIHSSGLLSNIQKFSAINWRNVLVPNFDFGGPFGNVDVNLPLWIPAITLLAIYLYLNRRDRRRHHATACVTCGYDLTGNTSGRCPECGSPTRKSPGVEC